MKQTNYEDIINLPHHTSSKHQRMPQESRAAQFAPFAALTGYDDAIKETTRITQKRINIDEETKNILNNKLQYILKNLNKKPEITFTYFIYDNKKAGGKYIEKTSIVKTIDMPNQYVILIDKTKINMNEIINIKGDIFLKIEE